MKKVVIESNDNFVPNMRADEVVEKLRAHLDRRGYTDMEIQPHSGGSAPMCYLTNGPVHLPLARGGLGHGGRNHVPDEYLVIEGDGKVAGLTEVKESYQHWIMWRPRATGILIR